VESQPPSIDRDSLLRQAVSLQQSGRWPEAADIYRKLLEAFPRDPQALTNLGTLALQCGKSVEGLQLLAISLETDPNQPAALFSRGIGLASLGRLEEALASFDQAIVLSPEYPESYTNRGRVLQALDRPEEAVLSFDRAISLKPDCIEGHTLRALALKSLGRLEEALTGYDRVIALQPGDADAYNDRGVILHELRRLDEAIASYDRAIALRPDMAQPYTNRGISLRDSNRLDDALASFNASLALKPDFADAYSNRGNVLKDLGRFGEALADYERAIALDPTHVFAHLNKALLRLLLGDFDEGWRLYEWRWKAEQRRSARTFRQPLWLGDRPIAGKTVLLHAEQGFGDTIQFCRYAPLVAALGARVILEVPAALFSLVSTLDGSLTIVERGGNPLSPVDLHCPLMSLPLALKTGVATIPAKVPYLRADPEKLMAWRERLGERSRPRIGLAWSGAKRHRNDHNRSIPLRLLEPLLGLPFEFHSLQKEIRSDDAPIRPGLAQIHSHASGLADFSDTAALIEQMDLIISVDTSVAHLAGALGKPVWILLPFIPDFRWLLGRTDSPWYPTATLFRQPAIGDWSSVIKKIFRLL
jgi:tetratricopeptide (TPR) repeat protein